MTHRSIIQAIAGCAILLTASACNGIFDGVYDEPRDDGHALTGGQLYVDATDWGKWYYIDFDSLQHLVETGDSLGLAHAQTHFTPYSIPVEETAGTDSTGIYTYWYDVFGEGISVNEKRALTHTAPQSEPDNWHIAIHRNNVRTNGGEVLETNYNSLDELPAQSAEFNGATFTPDEWSENEVWTVKAQMLSGLIGSQGIKINRVLSSWLKLDIPPMPPSFSMNSHVFLVRFSSRKMAALQLVNYMNSAGTKCFLTINYKYPY